MVIKFEYNKRSLLTRENQKLLVYEKKHLSRQVVIYDIL